MPRETEIDIIDFLSQVVEKHVQSYGIDFDFDKRLLTYAAQKPVEQERTFYWMCRKYGTWCFQEREVFLQNSDAYSTWLHYSSDAEQVKAFRVTVTRERDGKVMGTICPIHYAKQTQRVKKNALPISKVNLLLANGGSLEIPYEKWTSRQYEFINRFGSYLARFLPEDEQELSRVIREEHQQQRREAPRSSRTHRSKHTQSR